MKLQTFTDIADFHRVQDHCQWCVGVGVCMCMCASVLRMSVVYVLRVCVGCTFCFVVLCVLCCAVMCGVGAGVGAQCVVCGVCGVCVCGAT